MIGRAEAPPEMGTWGGAERLVHPTDQESGSLVVPGARGPEEEVRSCRPSPTTKAGKTAMRARITRVLITVSTVAMIAMAGGASLRGF